MRAQQFDTSADHRIPVATRQRIASSWWLWLGHGARMVKLSVFWRRGKGEIFAG